MTQALKAICAVIGLLLTLAAPVCAGPYEDAQAAEKRDDHATAIPIYRSLADRGNAAAMVRLGFFYEIGWGVKQDWLEAAKWYSKAAEAGDESAAGSLGFIGRHWRVFTQTDMNPVIYELVKKAAMRGNAAAQFSLGVMNYDFRDLSSDQDKVNPQEALIWYRRAAEQGDCDSQFSLGTAYERGIGVPQDYIEAHKWYNLAAPRSSYADIRDDIIKRRDALAHRMTRSQLAEAQRLAREWRPTPPPPQ
jgi:TPR repeat protein